MLTSVVRSTLEDALNLDAPAPRLIDALEAITAWRESAEEECATQMAEVDAEEARLRDAIAELERQIDALDGLRTDIHGRLSLLDNKEIAKSYRAVVNALVSDRMLLETRSELLVRQRKKNLRAAEELLKDPELAQAIEEYEGFGAVEAQLPTLPPSYRRAIVEHHEQVTRRLQPLIASVNSWGELLPEAPQSVALVASIDPAEGEPEALVLVLPVSAAIYNDWGNRDEDLCSLLAYRMVAAASELARQAGVPDAPIAYRSFEGNLTIQIWFGENEVSGNLREMAAGMLDQVKEEAAEYTCARVELYTLWLPPDVLTPPEEDVGEETAEESAPELPEDTNNMAVE
jgi:hypothetical protein